MSERTKDPTDEALMPTPMVRHYLRLKADHPDKILLYRIGDFYETFGDDAVDTSRILNITLTKKHIGSGRTLPLAGIPYHSLESYLGKLVSAGRRVAICEQMEDAREVKGRPVERDIVRIVTPGTLIEENLLDNRTNNYVVAAALESGRWGLARCDLSTGELAATQFEGDHARTAMRDEILRLGPSEVIAADEELALIHREIDEIDTARIMFTPIERNLSRPDRARAALIDQLRVQSLQGFGADDAPAAMCAAGAIVAYLRQVQRRIPGHIQHLDIYSPSSFLVLDAVTQRSLELTRNLIDGRPSGTLLGVLDHTRTPMGARLLRQWILQPLQELELIAARQDSIASLLNLASFRDQLGSGLADVRDLERILTRVHCRTATGRDLLALARSLRQVPALKSGLMQHGQGDLKKIGDRIPTLAELADRIESTLVSDPPVSITEGGLIREAFNPALDELRAVARGGKSWINELKRAESERTGISSLKIGYNRVFGYFIEISKSNLERVPPDWERRQTLTNAERFVTPELKEKEALILGAEEKINTLEQQIFEALRQEVEERSTQIQSLAADLAIVDALASLAVAAAEGGYVRPEVDASDLVEIKGGRHPVVEALRPVGAEARPFVPNDVFLDSREQQIWLITGPNMAGKSTFIRQTALIALMAHMGSFVPARSARIGLVDRIFTRVGATDYLTRGQSTFLVEMTETANILNNATPRSLVILDEIGRGTSTYDGLSIAWAVLEHLHEKKKRRARTLFATHYHELAELEGKLARVRNYSAAVKEQAGDHGEEIVFLYKIVAGHADHSYGIHAARVAGIPAEVVNRAREILFELECSHGAADPAAQTPGLPAMIEKLPARRPETNPAPMQLDMFAPFEHPVLEALRRIDPSHITPMQALRLLDELTRAAREGV